MESEPFIGATDEESELAEASVEEFTIPIAVLEDELENNAVS